VSSCGVADNAAQARPPGDTPSSDATRFGEDPGEVVRVTKDVRRQRVCVLRTPNQVRVYDASSARLEREVMLRRLGSPPCRAVCRRATH
jgi:hypothetical protein